MPLFIEGIELEKVETQTKQVTICQPEDDGPPLVVTVKLISAKEYNKIFEKPARDAARGMDVLKANEKARRVFYDTVIDGIEGDTVGNLNHVLRLEERLTGPKFAAAQKAKTPIFDRSAPNWVSTAAWFLYQNCLPQTFGNLIMDAVQSEHEAERDETERLKS